MSEKQSTYVYESRIPYDADRVGAAAIYCSDGRYGEQIDDLLHNGLGLPGYDRVAVPGGPAYLAGHFGHFFEEQGTSRQVEFLIRAHKLRRVVLIAHQDCVHYLQQLRINPADLERRQREDLIVAAQRVRAFGHQVEIVAFFARKVGGRVRFETAEC